VSVDFTALISEIGETSKRAEILGRMFLPNVDALTKTCVDLRCLLKETIRGAYISGSP